MTDDNNTRDDNRDDDTTVSPPAETPPPAAAASDDVATDRDDDDAVAGNDDDDDDAPRVVDEAAWAEENDDGDDDDDDVPLHFDAVAADDDSDNDNDAASAGAKATVARPDLEITLNADAEIPLSTIDEDALWVVKRLRAKGFEAYLTGGCVRDLLLGRQPKDFDVATAAHPNQVRAVFRNCRLVGRRFRLAHVIFPSGKVIETATFRANPTDTLEDLPDDLLVARDNVFGNVEEDARRRDLTINGLFYDPVAGKVLDYVDGRTDLEARLIRTIGDPDIRFQEDPVRILRAIKFAVRLGFEIEENTWAAMQRHAPGLLRCAQARLQEELLRLLASTYAKASLALCEKAGVSEVLWPELQAALRTLPAAEAAPPNVSAYVSDVSGASDGAEVADVAEAAVDVADTAVAVDASEDEGAVVTDEGAVATDEVPVSAEGAAVVDRAVDSAPVAMTPVLVPVDTAEARQARFAALLDTLDEVRRRDADITSALAFAVVVTPLWEALSDRPGAFDAWWQGCADAWTERLRLTRHDRERVPQILAAQYDLLPQRRRGHAARATVGRPSFRESLLLLIVRLKAAGASLEEVGLWKVVAASHGQPYQQPRFDRHRQRAAGRGAGSDQRRGRGRDRDRGERGERGNDRGGERGGDRGGDRGRGRGNGSGNGRRRGRS
jgi:poly(A) polymerase